MHALHNWTAQSGQHTPKSSMFRFENPLFGISGGLLIVWLLWRWFKQPATNSLLLYSMNESKTCISRPTATYTRRLFGPRLSAGSHIIKGYRRQHQQHPTALYSLLESPTLFDWEKLQLSLQQTVSKAQWLFFFVLLGKCTQTRIVIEVCFVRTCLWWQHGRVK
jgi:hypothetical protein